MAARIRDEVALVLEASSSGPGRGNAKASAVLYTREGARLAIVDSNKSAVEETAELLRSQGSDCRALMGDVTIRAGQAFGDPTVDHLRRIDILQNNVEFASLGGPVELEEIWDKAINLSLKGMFLTCMHVLPVMVRQGVGSIVFCPSYAAARAGVNQFSRAIAMEYAPKGIRCNFVLLGLIHTPTAHAGLGTQLAHAAEEAQ